MYQVIDMNGFSSGDNWQIRKNNTVVYSGSFRNVVRYAVESLGFEINDFERAIQSICYNQHNTLEFDRQLRLVATSYTPPEKLKRRA